jgi:hypothetical protein
MKSSLLIGFVLFTIIGCNNDPRMKLPQTGPYGKTFVESNLVSVGQVTNALDTTNNLAVVVSGTVSEYCKGEGCWLTLKNDDGEDLFVNIKDKAFVLPYNIEGKAVVVNGVAIKDTTNEKTELSIEADGVVLK